MDIAPSTLLDIKEPSTVVSKKVWIVLEVRCGNVKLCNIIETITMTLPQKRLVSLTCFTQCFCGALSKHGNCGFCIQELVMLKEPIKKLFFKNILVGHYLFWLV